MSPRRTASRTFSPSGESGKSSSNRSPRGSSNNRSVPGLRAAAHLVRVVIQESTDVPRRAPLQRHLARSAPGTRRDPRRGPRTRRRSRERCDRACPGSRLRRRLVCEDEKPPHVRVRSDSYTRACATRSESRAAGSSSTCFEPRSRPRRAHSSVRLRRRSARRAGESQARPASSSQRPPQSGRPRLPKRSDLARRRGFADGSPRLSGLRGMANDRGR